jgi:hypothetical protein
MVSTHASYLGVPRFKISARRPALLTDVFRDFPQSLQANAMIVLKLGHYRFISYPSNSLFINHPIMRH